MRLLPFEIRWMTCWFRTILPNAQDTAYPGADTLPLDAFIRDYFAHTPPGSSIGIRLASVLLTLLLCLRKARPLQRIARQERAEFLARLSTHKIYVLRELPMLLKLTAFLAWDAQDEVHRQLGVIGPLGPPAQWLNTEDRHD